MLNNIKELFLLLSKDQKKRILRLQVLVVIMAMFELVSVVSIGPFMAVVGDFSHLNGDSLIAEAYRYSSFQRPEDFLFLVGVVVLIVLTAAAIISTLTIWRLSLYAQQVGAELSTRLFKYYMAQPWLFHASGSSSNLTNKIAQESNRITSQILTPLMHMNAKVAMAILMSAAIFIYDPIIGISGVSIFLCSYLVLYRTARRKLEKNGKQVTDSQYKRYKLMSEGFGGIKDTLLLGRQQEFNEQFEIASQEYGRAQGKTIALSQVPRYAMELMAFGSIIFLVLYLLSSKNGNLSAILPVLSVYALAGFKLLPAFQQIYTGLATVRGNISAFESLKHDLKSSAVDSGKVRASVSERMSFKYEIALENIFFNYPNKKELALNDLSIRFPKNSVIGLVGSSGSGKSTAIDILLGLISPSGGVVKVDDQILEKENLRIWQNCVGFVPQSIFLSDKSIRENIAFGLPPKKISEERVKNAVHMAHLDELIARLPDGLDTIVGERGIQLSGGQRQRIGIARALYDDADVLVLDEATSALDGITEKIVMDAIHDFSGKKTIIMIAHRLATVKKCDCIYLMQSGNVVDHGTYEELIEKNSIFRQMSKHS